MADGGEQEDKDPEGREAMQDRELIRLARAGDGRCLTVLLDRYRIFTRLKARSYFLPGSDPDDVIQEGMIGLFKAVRDFDLGQDVPFKAFAELCISRQIQSAVKSANRHKHAPLNGSISLDAPARPEAAEGTSLAEQLGSSRADDPAELIISAVEIEALRDSLKKRLTELEGDVLLLYMDGKSYEEIAGTLGNGVKSIDNALQRIKRKLQHYAERRNIATS
jgi:RNA polymerase sigma-H factor